MTEIKETIVRVRQNGGILEVEDWRGRVHRCQAADLGQHVERLLAEPDLPKVDVVSPGVDQVIHMYAAQFVPPEVRSLAVPGFQIVQWAFRYFQQAQRQAAERRYQEHAERQQSQPQPPPREQHRQAHRRGQRVG